VPFQSRKIHGWLKVSSRAVGVASVVSPLKIVAVLYESQGLLLWSAIAVMPGA
jgi:hypothetical protein